MRMPSTQAPDSEEAQKVAEQGLNDSSLHVFCANDASVLYSDFDLEQQLKSVVGTHQIDIQAHNTSLFSCPVRQCAHDISSFESLALMIVCS